MTRSWARASSRSARAARTSTLLVMTDPAIVAGVLHLPLDEIGRLPPGSFSTAWKSVSAVGERREAVFARGSWPWRYDGMRKAPVGDRGLSFKSG